MNSKLNGLVINGKTYTQQDLESIAISLAGMDYSKLISYEINLDNMTFEVTSIEDEYLSPYNNKFEVVNSIELEDLDDFLFEKGNEWIFDNEEMELEKQRRKKFFEENKNVTLDDYFDSEI